MPLFNRLGTLGKGAGASPHTATGETFRESLHWIVLAVSPSSRRATQWWIVGP